jgi:hypothetical protein
LTFLSWNLFIWSYQDTNAFFYFICKFLNNFPFPYASFQDLSFKKAFFFFSLLFFFRFIRLSYSAALIKILWILFTCILFFLGFLTTFSSLVDILKYLYFLILAPSVRCDPSQSYLTKKKNFNSSQIRTTRNIFISKGYKKWYFLISSKIGQDW